LIAADRCLEQATAGAATLQPLVRRCKIFLDQKQVTGSLSATAQET
jgi:hypothetical protein